MGSAIHIHLQGSQENVSHGASSSPCCLVQQVGALACNTFQCYPVNRPLPPSLLLEPMPKGSWPHGTTCYVVAAGSLQPVESPALLPAGYPATSSVEPQAPLPAGFPVDYTSCIVDPVHDIISLFTLFTEPMVGKT